MAFSGEGLSSNQRSCADTSRIRIEEQVADQTTPTKSNVLQEMPRGSLGVLGSWNWYPTGKIPHLATMLFHSSPRLVQAEPSTTLRPVNLMGTAHILLMLSSSC